MSKSINELVAEVHMPRNITPGEAMTALPDFGFTIQDLLDDVDLGTEIGIALRVLRACNALGLDVTHNQALTVARHSVAAHRYPRGVRLSNYERAIALRLYAIFFKYEVEKSGGSCSDEEVQKSSHRFVEFGERGLHAGHAIGQASGCFSVLLLGIAVSAVLWNAVR